ncbi:hypothetical protein ACS5NO_12795 [Larkinella sp. GY13]|uniref:hypothetical protein n=1 Tax=Larkinella sp. GY13 TaxID=3453720 RepID=UPI003EECE5B7
MRERYQLENNEAAPQEGAAFILDRKTGLRVKVLHFRTLLQMDSYEPTGFAMPVRHLPILLEALPSNLQEKELIRIVVRMVDWYYYTEINPPPADNPPVSGSAG